MWEKEYWEIIQVNPSHEISHVKQLQKVLHCCFKFTCYDHLFQVEFPKFNWTDPLNFECPLFVLWWSVPFVLLMHIVAVSFLAKQALNFLIRCSDLLLTILVTILLILQPYTSKGHFRCFFLCSVVAQCDSCVYPEVKVFFQNSHSNQLMEITHLMKKFLGVYEIDDTKKWLVLLQIVNSYRKTIIVIVNMNFKRHHIS